MTGPTVAPLNEFWHDGGFLVSEANGHRARDQITLSGGVKVYAGTVLGTQSIGTTAAAAAQGTNTGNGTFGAITLAAGVQVGVYTVEFDSASTYVVTAPNGQQIGHSTVGVAFSGGGLGFTITAGSPGTTATAAAIGTNVGNGTFGTIAVASPAIAGAYTVRMESATTFIVESPAGVEIGHGSTGVAFSAGGIGFTLTAGGTAFTAGDSFTLTTNGAGVSFAPADSFSVTVAVGNGKSYPLSLTATDGTGVPSGILWGTTDVTSADKSTTRVSRACEVNASELVWPTGATNNQISAFQAQLLTLGIVCR